jgi:hypothetical protein
MSFASVYLTPFSDVASQICAPKGERFEELLVACNDLNLGATDHEPMIPLQILCIAPDCFRREF